MKVRKGSLGVGIRWLLSVPFLIGLGQAQIPDVRFHLDLYGSYDLGLHNSGSLRLSSPTGDSSTVQISLLIQQGLKGYFSERFVQFPNDPSRDPLEQYYIEDEGIWRLGKQYVPFGSGNLVRENVLAARGQTNLLLENIKIVAALCDGGPGDQQGFVGRIGGLFGVSAAVGRHFGISPTSFNVLRSPEASPGSGHGWKSMFGADDSRKIGQFTTAAELVWLQNGETSQDRDQTIFDLSETFQPDRRHQFLVGYSYGTDQSQNVVRFTAHIPMTKSTDVEPLLRYRNGKFWDSGVTFHVRL